MKVAICYFTYSKDEPLLRESLKGVKYLPKEETEVFIFDDAASPLSEEMVKELKGDHYGRTTFARNRNLNGLDCVKGMLECYKKAFELSEADWVLKVDSDTYPNSIEWLRNLDPNKVGEAATWSYKTFGHGCYHAYSKKGIEFIEAFLNNEANQERISHMSVCEDIMTSRILIASGLIQQQFLNINNSLKTCRGCYQDFPWDEGQAPGFKYLTVDEYPIARSKMGVTFKSNMHGKTDEACDKNREDAVRRMKAYAAWVDAEEAKKEEDGKL